MRTFTFSLIVFWLSLAWVVQAQQDKLPPIIDREFFFDNPEIVSGRLSPDGKYLSFLKPYKGTLNIWVKTIDEPFDKALRITEDTTRPLYDYRWSRDSKYIIYAQDQGGDENFNLYAVKPSEAKAGVIPKSRDLTGLKGVSVNIYSMPQTDPDAVYIGLNDRDKAWHDLYKVKISTGEKTLVRKNSDKDRLTGYVFDWNDKLRLATRANQDWTNDILRVDDDKLEVIYTTGIFETAYPVAYNKENNKVYLVSNKGAETDLLRLVLLDPVSLKEEVIESDPQKKVDLKNVVISDLTKDILYTVYEDEKERYEWKDANLRNDYKKVSEQLPNVTIRFFHSTYDEKLWLVNGRSDVDPGTTYLYERATGKLTKLYSPFSRVPAGDLAQMKPIQYKSSDGLIIPAYLTLPKGIESKNLPLVVFPHGGPWGRDSWGYDSFAQFLANRGYAVLMPNFRGSTGYGKKFVDAGNNEWGQKMQDDITYGIKYLVDEGIVDSKRVGIMGVSYGGYATLAGLAFTPELYACGVDIVGPSNLMTLLNTIPPYWESIRTLFHYRMGDPNTPEGKAQLEKQSPLNSASNIKVPLMVVQGANDPRVNIHESDQIVVALRERGAPVEYIVAPDEGHGFARPVNNMAMLAAAEKFLAKYLGGRYQSTMSPEVEKRLKEITMDVKNVKLTDKSKIVN